MEFLYALILLALYSTFFLFLFWGVYILQLNKKDKLNQGFFFLCLTLSIWAFGFASASVQSNITTVLLWRRLAAIGWSSVYSILVHFLFILTRTKSKYKYYNLLYLLHIPALFSMVIFSFSNTMAQIHYNLVQAPFGWINLAVNSIYDYIFYVYYFVYMAVGLLMVWNWKKQISSKKRNRESTYIFWALLSALILGSLSDIWLNRLFTSFVPQLGPLVFLIPMGTIYHAARYNGLFENISFSDNEVILTKINQKRVFYNLSWVFLLGGGFSLLSSLFQQTQITQESIRQALLRAGIIACFGIVLMINQKFQNDKSRENINNVILLVSIPLITMLYLDQASANIWVISIIVMIGSLVFNKKVLLISSAVVGIITQRLIWVLRPQTLVIINEYDFILRIGLLILVFSLTLSVNHIYVARLKEIAYQISFQKINAEISSEFVAITKDNFDERVDSLLAKLGNFFGVDRTYLFLLDHKSKTMTYSHEWCQEGIDVEVNTIKDIPFEEFAWWIEKLDKEKLIYIADVQKMPLEAHEEQQQLIRQNIKSVVAVPIMGDGLLEGFIGIDSVKEKKYGHLKILSF